MSLCLIPAVAVLSVTAICLAIKNDRMGNELMSSKRTARYFEMKSVYLEKRLDGVGRELNRAKCELGLLRFVMGEKKSGADDETV